MTNLKTKKNKVIKGWVVIIKTPKGKSFWLKNQYGGILGARIYPTKKYAQELYPSKAEIIIPVGIKLLK